MAASSSNNTNQTSSCDGNDSNTEPTSDQREYLASGLKLTLHGIFYQLKVLMLFVYQAYHLKYEDFCLATEMNAAGKLDDVVFERTISKNVRFAQVKHKKNAQKEMNKISEKDLISTDENNPFNLMKYFLSFYKIKQESSFKDKNISDVSIITNTTFMKKNKWFKKDDNFKKDSILFMKNSSFEAERFQFHSKDENAIIDLKLTIRSNLLKSILKSKLFKNESKGIIAISEKIEYLQKKFEKSTLQAIQSVWKKDYTAEKETLVKQLGGTKTKKMIEFWEHVININSRGTDEEKEQLNESKKLLHDEMKCLRAENNLDDSNGNKIKNEDTKELLRKGEEELSNNKDSLEGLKVNLLKLKDVEKIKQLKKKNQISNIFLQTECLKITQKV